MSEAWMASTTVGKREDAQKLADLAVQRRLAACVQMLGPIVSTYRWQGAVEQSEEFLLLLKTTPAAYPALHDLIRSAHPYETPEIVAWPLSAVSPDYLAWLSAAVEVPANP